MDKKNYFLNSERASDYDRTRPSFHKEALASYHQTKPLKLYDVVLDIGCGTGRSAIALTDWAKKVEAVDSSEAMLQMASPHSMVNYQKASAENLPFDENVFDLIFVASSLHWFERRKFLSQVSRVLKPRGRMLIYDSYMTEGLSSEFHKLFSLRFPRPYKDTALIEMELDFFNLYQKDFYRFDYECTFTRKDVAEYFFNLSNVEAAMEKGEDKQVIQDDIRKLVESQSTGDPYKFQVQLTEIFKK